MSLLRFHWDFFGPDASESAGHFLKHLDEFCDRNGIREYRHWVRDQKVRAVAILECDERYLQIVRDRLRPKRGERVIGD